MIHIEVTRTVTIWSRPRLILGVAVGRLPGIGDAGPGLPRESRAEVSTTAVAA